VRERLPAQRLRAQNVALAAGLAEACAARGMRFVLASTSSVYGDAAQLPTPESAPLAPLNDYARSKVAAEAACARGDYAIARLFTVYGPGQRPDMAFARWIGCLERGEPLAWCAARGAARDFTFVGDTVRGLIAVLERGRGGSAYNIGGPGPVTVRAALRELERATGRSARLAPFDHGVSEARVTAACGRRAHEELGYAPRVGLAEGLRRQVDAAARLSPPAVAA
jgi:nucleoside-diphosphate-sugar epimerase